MLVKIGSVNAKSAQALVVGRDALVDQFWRELSRTSLQVLSERRMGKTWVLHLAQARQPAEFYAVFLNVEDLKSTKEFTQHLLHAVYANTPERNPLYKGAGLIMEHLPRVLGKDIGRFKIPEIKNWKEDIEGALKTFQYRIGERAPVLILDELPHLLDSIIQAGRPEEAAELLDTLRALRQSMPKLRMVYCGSLGFHIVFEKLRKAGYNGRPVNDMGTFDVPPLDEDAATTLAGGLLQGNGVPCGDIASVARAVAQASSGVPFYIQHLVQWMSRFDDIPWTPEAMTAALTGIFDDTADPLQFQYYNHRLDQYYLPEQVELARVVLDILSHHDEGYEAKGLLNRVMHHPKHLGLAHDELLELLDILRNDHYLITRGDVYRFKLDIVRKWWYTSRGKLRS